MLHVNYFGVDPLHALYKRFEPYQVRDAWGTHEKQWWVWPPEKPDIRFAYINPACKAWRECFVAAMVQLAGGRKLMPCTSIRRSASSMITRGGWAACQCSKDRWLSIASCEKPCPRWPSAARGSMKSPAATRRSRSGTSGAWTMCMAVGTGLACRRPSDQFLCPSPLHDDVRLSGLCPAGIGSTLRRVG